MIFALCAYAVCIFLPDPFQEFTKLLLMGVCVVVLHVFEEWVNLSAGVVALEVPAFEFSIAFGVVGVFVMLYGLFNVSLSGVFGIFFCVFRVFV